MTDDHTVWLVEWPEDDNVPTRWWNPRTGWMRDANKALHLSRKEDAEHVIATSRFVSGGVIRATEHKFCEQPKASEAPVQTGAAGSVPGWKLMPAEPTPGKPVIALWGEKHGSAVEWAVLTTDDGWYAADPDGAPVNACPTPVMWCYPPSMVLSASPSPPVQERQEVGGGEFKPDWTLTETERAIVALSLALPKHIPNWPGCTDEQMEAVATSALAERHREPQPVGGGHVHANGSAPADVEKVIDPTAQGQDDRTGIQNVSVNNND